MTHMDMKRFKRLASTTLATVSAAAFSPDKMNAESRCPSVISSLVAKASSSSSKPAPVIVTPASSSDSSVSTENEQVDNAFAQEYGASDAYVSEAHLSFVELVQNSSYESYGNSHFELQNQKLLRINLQQNKNSMAWIKYGTRVASLGNVKFRAAGMREQRLTNVLKKSLTAEGMKLVKCEGNGVVFCADEQKLLHVLQLEEEEVLFVNGSNLLAICADARYEIKFMNGMNLASGIFFVKLIGKGLVTFGCHGAVVALAASEESPVYTDPNATVAWTHAPTVKVDMSLKSLIGKGSGEEVQLEFKQGFVVVQPQHYVPVRESIKPSVL